jgi:S1-C subfamily serine protease
MRRWLFLPMAIVASWGIAIAQDVSVDTVEAVQMATVPILCLRTGAQQEIQYRATVGTGFFVNRSGDFLTVGHVIEDLEKLKASERCFAAIYVPKVLWRRRYETTLGDVRTVLVRKCFSWKELDAGACGVEKNPFQDPDLSPFVKPLALGTFKKLRDGSPIAFTGFPAQSIFPITSKGYVASYDPLSGRVIIDKPSWPGSSGSPVYSSDGRAIGILVQGGINSKEGLSFAIFLLMF